MKDYNLTKDDNEPYIVDIYREDGTLSVVFADGRIFRNIEVCDENFEKIIAVQEEQAKKGIANYKKFKNKERGSIAMTAISGASILSAGAALTNIPAIHEMFISHPVMISAGIGTVALLGTIPALVNLKRNRGIVQELDKLRYRDEHLDELRSFRNYPNSLVGVDTKLVRWMRKEKDPFCILSIDRYSLEDLEQIMGNIQTEKTFGFTYVKKKSKSE